MVFSVAEHFHTVMLTDPCSSCISQMSLYQQHLIGSQTHCAGFNLIQLFFLFSSTQFDLTKYPQLTDVFVASFSELHEKIDSSIISVAIIGLETDGDC